MIKQKLALAAEQIIADRDSGNITAVGILIAPMVYTFPFVFPYFSCLFFLEKDSEGERLANLTFRLSASGKEVLKQSAPVNFGGAAFAYFSIRLNGLVVETPGIVKMELIENNGVVVASYDFNVVAQPTQAQPKVVQAPLEALGTAEASVS